MIFKVYKCIFFILVDSLLVIFAKSDVIRIGKCPLVRLQRGFKQILVNYIEVKRNSDILNNFKFVGDWYEVARNPIMFFSNTKCNKIKFKKDVGKYNFTSFLTFK